MTRIQLFFLRVSTTLLVTFLGAGVLQVYEFVTHVEQKLALLENRQAIVLSAVCQNINMQSSKPQQLSYEECLRYFYETFSMMKKMNTPTPFEKETSRPGLEYMLTPSPTPCDPHVSLCFKQSGR